MANPIVRERYNRLVLIEFGALAIGAIALGALGWSDYTPVLVCAGVGVHFLPLARVLRNGMLIPLGISLIITAVVSLVVGLGSDVAMSAMTGLGAGVQLVMAACLSLANIPRPAGRAA